MAIVQVYLTRTDYLSPWKGGGFGMFSTNDYESRELQIWVLAPDGERRVGIPRGARGDAIRAEVFPSARRLAAFGRKVAKIGRAEGIDFSRVRIQVWRTAFSAQTFEPRLELIREAVIDANQLPQER